jgi:GNAT superfamily N-acetyltransferase
MDPVPHQALRLAEDLNTHAPLRSGSELILRNTHTIHLRPGSGPGATVVQRLRLAGQDIPGILQDVRLTLAGRGRTGASWEVGPSATPVDLVDRLIALGLTPDPHEPVASGMVLTSPPPCGPPEIQVRAVESVADFEVSRRILETAFRTTIETGIDEEYRDFQGSAGWVRFLATHDDRPVATADAVAAEGAIILAGGATLPDARGHGAYRSLVRARWEAAAAFGTPCLVTQAGSMSRPILERLGFREVTRIRILIDGS